MLKKTIIVLGSIGLAFEPVCQLTALMLRAAEAPVCASARAPNKYNP